jgi:hypothetical protein
MRMVFSPVVQVAEFQGLSYLPPLISDAFLELQRVFPQFQHSAVAGSMEYFSRRKCREHLFDFFDAHLPIDDDRHGRMKCLDCSGGLAV